MRRNAADEKPKRQIMHKNPKNITSTTKSHLNKSGNLPHDSYKHEFQNANSHVHPHPEKSNELLKNIVNSNSRIERNWSPEHRQQIKNAGDKHIGQFIKDVLEDLFDRELTVQNARDYLDEVGYGLQV